MRTREQEQAAYNGLTPAEFARAFYGISTGQVYRMIDNREGRNEKT